MDWQDIDMNSRLIQYSQRGTFINPLTPVVRINHARSNTAVEHPLTLVVMTLAYRDNRTRGFAVVAREGSSRSTVFHRLHCTCKLYEIGTTVSGHRDPRCSYTASRGVHCRGQLNTSDHPKYRQKNTDRGGHFQRIRWGKSRWRVFKWRFRAGCTIRVYYKICYTF